jgi:predicted RNase H-like HicB family nuclease
MVIKIERKPLDFYLSLKYPVTLIPDETGGYAVEIEELPGCFSQGETVEEAMLMIDDARRLWLESAYEDGLDIPLPSNETEFSGKFNVRVPVSLHRKLHRLAGKEGVSLNQYVVYALSHMAGVAESRKHTR